MSFKLIQNCRKFSFILCFMLYLQSSFAQYNFNKADHWLTDNLNDLGGRAVLVIFKNGNIIYEKAENDLSRKQKVIGKFVAKRQGKDVDEILKDYTFTTRASIASSSKWLSAALVMTFVDEGKLDPDDTIGKFLPVFTLHQKGNITIWECLSHLTAINAGNLKDSREIINQGATMSDVIEKIAEQPMEGEPGNVFHYSSIGLQIAAAVIEKVSGKDFKTLFSERIAIPCDMKNTDFGNARPPAPARSGSGGRAGTDGDDPVGRGKVALAAGGAFSTPKDYIHFLQMILQHGMYNGKQVLSKESVELMQHNYAKGAKVAYSPAEAGNWGYGFGEWVMDDAVNRSASVTSPGLFGSFPWVDNERKYAGFLFVFNLKQKRRNKMYKELKAIIDNEIDKH